MAFPETEQAQQDLHISPLDTEVTEFSGNKQTVGFLKY